jgi:hypothetical protein
MERGGEEKEQSNSDIRTQLRVKALTENDTSDLRESGPL